VVRGVTVATVAAVAVSGGAFALAGPTPDAGTAAEFRVPGAVVPAAGRSVLTVPVPDVLGAGAAEPTAVLDPATLSRAVARAHVDARRIAADTRARDVPEAQERTAAEADEDDRTAERARRAVPADPDSTGEPGCDLATGRLGPVKPYVRTAAEFLGCAFGEPTVLGVAGRSNASDHPQGRALDFMVDRATGDRLAACALRNREALGVSYVIWRQRIDTGNGFRPMPDRGSPTANHFDHVHVSFEPAAGTGDPVDC
jgi:hypothetical protein